MIKLVYVRTYKSGQFVLLRSVNKSMKPSGALEFSWQGPHQVVDRGVVRQYVANSNITMCLATGGLYKQTMYVCECESQDVELCETYGVERGRSCFACG